MRLLTLQSLFSTSPSTVSFSPDDCAPSVSTTLGYSTLASDEAVSIRAQQPGEAVAEAGGSHPHVRLNDPALWITPPCMHPLCCLFHSLSDCCSYGAELPAAAILEGQPASFPPAKKNNRKKKDKEKRRGNQFLIKRICKAASKGVKHLLWHRRQALVTLRTLAFTWQITRVPIEEESVAFVLIDRRVVAHQACKSMPGRLPVWALAGRLDLFHSALC